MTVVTTMTFKSKSAPHHHQDFTVEVCWSQPTQHGEYQPGSTMLEMKLRYDDFLGFRINDDYDVVLLDILDLAFAIQSADRFHRRKPDCEYTFDIHLDVRMPDVLQHNAQFLSETLYDLTGDLWVFTFSQSSVCTRMALDLADIGPSGDSHVALWSGGLDAAAGLVGFIDEVQPSQIVLMGFGNSNRHKAHLKRSYEYIEVLAKTKAVHTQLSSRIFMSTGRLGSHQGSKFTTNVRARSRCLVFLLIAGVVARLEGHSTVQVFENGVGALNLPYHSDNPKLQSRGVRPRTMLNVSDLLSRITGQTIPIEHRCLFTTKGTMTARIKNKYELDLAQFVSCDRNLRIRGVRHCGWCSSCILRRVSQFSAGGVDIADLTYDQAPNGVKKHILHMYAQIQRISDAVEAPEPWFTLADQFPVLYDIANDIVSLSGGTVNEVGSRLTEMYKTYAHEWSMALPMMCANEPALAELDSNRLFLEA